MILVAEDEASIARIIMLNLRAAGYSTQIESDGLGALAAIRERRPAAVVLDVGLPGLDGIEVCRQLRQAGDDTPVLFVTARDDEVDRVLGLELGGDDYVTKPFSPRELVARVSGVLRRVRGGPDLRDTETPPLRCGDVVIDSGRRRVLLRGDPITLTATEFDLLAFLLRHAGQVFSRSQLLAEVWQNRSDAGPRTVDVHVAQIRSKLGTHEVISTRRGLGYAGVRDRP